MRSAKPTTVARAFKRNRDDVYGHRLMGMPYALLKQDKPEVFDLGKGVRMVGWTEVFERRYGPPFSNTPADIFNIFGSDDKGNFLEPLQSLDLALLTKRLEKFDHGYSGEAAVVAKRIIDWMGDDVCYLCNYWEELSGCIESRMSAKKIAAEFNDLAVKLSVPMAKYKETGDVWGSDHD
jgi:hypothetical protein